MLFLPDLFTIEFYNALNIPAAINDTNNCDRHGFGIHRVKDNKVIHRHFMHSDTLPRLPIHQSIAGRHKRKRTDFLSNSIYLFLRCAGSQEFLCNVCVDAFQVIQCFRRIRNLI